MRPDLLGPLRSMVEAEGLGIRVAGVCMEPRVADGARVHLSPGQVYWPGDVVAFVGGAGRLVAHRLIGYRPERGGLRLWTQADAASRPDAPIPRRLVLGRLETPVSIADRAGAMRAMARHLVWRLRARWR